jgi:predicted PurR-regulated permease PerM
VSKQEIKEVTNTATKAAVEASWLQTRLILRVIVIVLLTYYLFEATRWIIVKLTGVILLLVLAIFFSYLVAPLVEFLSRPIRISGRKFAMPRALAIIFSYVVLIAVIVMAIYALAPRLGSQLPQFAEQAKGYGNALTKKTEAIDEYFRQRMPATVLDRIKSNLPQVISAEDTFKAITAAMLSWLGYIPWLVLIPVLSFFLLKDVETFRRSALQMLPRGRWRWRGDEFFQDVNSTLASYIRAQLTACLFIGLVCTLGFTLFGLPNPLALGAIAGVCEFVPLVGPSLVALVAAVAGLLHGGGFHAFFVLVFLLVLRGIQDYIVYPRLIGQGIHLHPLAVIVAILAGAELAGVAGIFLAIPLVAILTVSYRHWLEHRGSEGLADLLEPTPVEGVAINDLQLSIDQDQDQDREMAHPSVDTTPEEMARERPDLTTGELKMPVED